MPFFTHQLLAGHRGLEGNDHVRSNYLFKLRQLSSIPIILSIVRLPNAPGHHHHRVTASVQCTFPNLYTYLISVVPQHVTAQACIRSRVSRLETDVQGLSKKFGGISLILVGFCVKTLGIRGHEVYFLHRHRGDRSSPGTMCLVGYSAYVLKTGLLRARSFRCKIIPPVMQIASFHDDSRS